MKPSPSRREFLTATGKAAAMGVGLSGVLASCGNDEGPEGNDPGAADSEGTETKTVGKIRLPGKPGEVDLAIAESADFGKATEDALNEFGGLGHFVKKGDNVVLSPNIAFARVPEVGACTHPDVIRKLILLCEAAEAGSVTVVDYLLDTPASVTFEICGATEAVKGTSAKLVSPDREALYAEVPGFSDLKGHKGLHLTQSVPKALLDAEVLITMPVAKNHAAAKVSFSMKKGMGLIWERKAYHQDLHQCIADLNLLLRPSLIVMDATRSLQTGGPKGPGEVTQPNQVVVGVDPVAVDAYCCRYLTVEGTRPEDVPHLAMAEEYGIGTTALDSLSIKEIAA